MLIFKMTKQNKAKSFADMVAQFSSNWKKIQDATAAKNKIIKGK